MVVFMLTGCSTNNEITSSTGGSTTSTSVEELKESFVPNVGEVKMLFDDGTIGETQRYNYCPSYFIENNVAHVFYCTNKDEGNVTDYVGYRRGVIKD